MSNAVTKKQIEVKTLHDKIFKVATMADVEKYKKDLEGINEKMFEKIILTLDYINLMERTKVMFAAAIYLDSRAIIGILKKELVENCDLAKLYIDILCYSSEVTTVNSDRRYSADTDAASLNSAAGALVAPLHEHRPQIGTLWSDVFDALATSNIIKAVGDLLETVYRFIPNQAIGFCIRKVYEKLPDDDFDECRNDVKKVGAQAYCFTPEEAYYINKDMEELEKRVNKYGSNYAQANVKLYRALFLVNAKNCGVTSIDISMEPISRYFLEAKDGKCEFAENALLQNCIGERESPDNDYCEGDYETFPFFGTYDDDDSYDNDGIDTVKEHKSKKHKSKKRKAKKKHKRINSARELDKFKSRSGVIRGG